jgi:hypothetical protein
VSRSQKVKAPSVRSAILVTGWVRINAEKKEKKAVNSFLCASESLLR